MEHSLGAYLERQSTEELKMLLACYLPKEEYAYVIPLIQCILHDRGVPLSPALQDCAS